MDDYKSQEEPKQHIMQDMFVSTQDDEDGTILDISAIREDPNVTLSVAAAQHYFPTLQS